MVEKQLKVNHSLLKAFTIIEIMTVASEEMSLNDISKQASIPKATALRLIYTLMTIGYVQQNKKNANYSLSLKFQLLAYSSDIYQKMVSVVRPFIKELSLKLSEATHLSICDSDELVYIESIDGFDSLLKVTQKIGKRSPLYCTGAGKLYLAAMNLEELDCYFKSTILQPLTSHTLITKRAIKKELKKIQTDGYSIDDEECEMGVKCVAVPVYNKQGEIACSLSVSMPTIRITEAKMTQTINLLIETAKKIPI